MTTKIKLTLDCFADSQLALSIARQLITAAEADPRLTDIALYFVPQWAYSVEANKVLALFPLADIRYAMKAGLLRSRREAGTTFYELAFTD